MRLKLLLSIRSRILLPLLGYVTNCVRWWFSTTAVSLSAYRFSCWVPPLVVGKDQFIIGSLKSHIMKISVVRVGKLFSAFFIFLTPLLTVKELYSVVCKALQTIDPADLYTKSVTLWFHLKRTQNFQYLQQFPALDNLQLLHDFFPFFLPYWVCNFSFLPLHLGASGLSESVRVTKAISSFSAISSNIWTFVWFVFWIQIHNVFSSIQMSQTSV